MDNGIWFIVLIGIFIGIYLKDMTNIMNLKSSRYYCKHFPYINLLNSYNYTWKNLI